MKKVALAVITAGMALTPLAALAQTGSTATPTATPQSQTPAGYTPYQQEATQQRAEIIKLLSELKHYEHEMEYEQNQT